VAEEAAGGAGRGRVSSPSDAATVPRPDHREMKTLTEAEVQRLFNATADDRLAALWVLLITTGLRLGEALGLQWSDIDLASRKMVVQRALQRQRGSGLVLTELKTRKSRRLVHLAPMAVSALIEHRRRQARQQLLLGAEWQDTGLVFTSLKGGPMEPHVSNEALDRALAVAGLPRVRVHDLRHTAASLLLARGVHAKVV